MFEFILTTNLIGSDFKFENWHLEEIRCRDVFLTPRCNAWGNWLVREGEQGGVRSESPRISENYLTVAKITHHNPNTRTGNRIGLRVRGTNTTALSGAMAIGATSTRQCLVIDKTFRSGDSGRRELAIRPVRLECTLFS